MNTTPPFIRIEAFAREEQGPQTEEKKEISTQSQPRSIIREQARSPAGLLKFIKDSSSNQRFSGSLLVYQNQNPPSLNILTKVKLGISSLEYNLFTPQYSSSDLYASQTYH